ncbi:MAG: G5 domain-containing protein [Clostridia bacterium]|nr:G5 domain-containing protein [Clostridia bacterium]
MDNQNRQNIPRNRQDSISPEQRRGMQQGYPIREDATQTIERPINRPTGPREVPQSMRQGKIPVRQNANTGRTYPVMNRGAGSPAAHTPAQKSAQTEIMDRPRPQRPKEDPLEATREFPVVSGAVQQQTDTAAKRSVPLKKLWILPVVIAVLTALGLCVGIAAALSAEPAALPDFDMSATYVPETEELSEELHETAGVARAENTEETEPPETEPPVPKFNVTLTFYERDPITVSTDPITLGELLLQVGYTVEETDKFPLDLDAMLTEETTIAVDTVQYDTMTETVTLPYQAKVTNVQTIPRGQKNVIQAGKNGQKTITYSIKLVNGVETERVVEKEEITVAPVDEVSHLGVGGTLVGNDGQTYSYSYYRIVNATYYDIEGLTYLGYDADESVVAVDMDYIPLGTKIYVKNSQFDFGVRTAADTGSMIEGWEVDIWLSDSNPQKAAFAQIGYVKDMVIYYLD